MATLVKLRCRACSAVSDIPVDEVLLDLVEDAYALFFTCARCGEFCTKLVNDDQLGRLQTAGVFTVSEMAEWIIEELEEELDP